MPSSTSVGFAGSVIQLLPSMMNLYWWAPAGTAWVTVQLPLASVIASAPAAGGSS